MTNHLARRGQGISVFGPLYQRVFENDLHAPGSVDRVLWQSLILITSDGTTSLYVAPAPLTYRQGKRPVLERFVARLPAPATAPESFLDQLTARLADLAALDDVPIEQAEFGGTEEQILARRTSWCVDLSRAACALCQVAGLPARLVALADTATAYSGHQIIEVFRQGIWGAADPITAVVYRHHDGQPATVAELQADPWLVEAHASPRRPYTKPQQFRAVAITTYSINDAACYDYRVSGVNAYYRQILTHAEAGWPGGLRWLHGESAARGATLGSHRDGQLAGTPDEDEHPAGSGRGHGPV